MNMSDILQVIEKVLLVPPYYSDGEGQLSIAVSVFAAAMGAAIGRVVIRPAKNSLIILSLIAVLVAAFLLHWFYLYEKGGVFYWQLACRGVFFVCFGMLGLSFGKGDGDGDKNG